MAKQTIDCRGLACPQPVIQTKKALEQTGAAEIEVLLDNEIACENVSRFAQSRGWTVDAIVREGKELRLTLKPGRGESCGDPSPKPTEEEKILVYCHSDRMGQGDDGLGEVLMRSFIKSLADMAPQPQRIVFANGGVRLTTEGSALLETLQGYEKQGIEIFSCGTCLDYLGLKEKLRVGRATNMFEILSAMWSFDRVVRP